MHHECGYVYSCDHLYECYNSYTCFYCVCERVSLCRSNSNFLYWVRILLQGYCTQTFSLAPDFKLTTNNLLLPASVFPQLEDNLCYLTSPTSFLSDCLHLPLPLSSSFITFSPELIYGFLLTTSGLQPFHFHPYSSTTFFLHVSLFISPAFLFLFSFRFFQISFVRLKCPHLHFANLGRVHAELQIKSK